MWTAASAITVAVLCTRFFGRYENPFKEIGNQDEF
jgi:hypothetical protein